MLRAYNIIYFECILHIVFSSRLIIMITVFAHPQNTVLKVYYSSFIYVILFVIYDSSNPATPQPLSSISSYYFIVGITLLVRTLIYSLLEAYYDNFVLTNDDSNESNYAVD